MGRRSRRVPGRERAGPRRRRGTVGHRADADVEHRPTAVGRDHAGERGRGAALLRARKVRRRSGLHGVRGGAWHRGPVHRERRAGTRAGEGAGKPRRLRRGVAVGGEIGVRGAGVDAVPRDVVASVGARPAGVDERRADRLAAPRRVRLREQRDHARGVRRRGRGPAEAVLVAAALLRRLGAVRRGEHVECLGGVGVAGDPVGLRVVAAAVVDALALAERHVARQAAERRGREGADLVVVHRADGQRGGDARRPRDPPAAAAVARGDDRQDARVDERLERRGVGAGDAVAVAGPGGQSVSS